MENKKETPNFGCFVYTLPKIPEGPIVLGTPQWKNFQKCLRKVGFVDYTKNESKITYPRLRTFRKKILKHKQIYRNTGRYIETHTDIKKHTQTYKTRTDK